MNAPEFDPGIPPPGFELKLISFWTTRAMIAPRLQLVHTNAASRQGNIEAAYNWANQPGSDHTIPHFQIDRDGRAAMLLPLNRKGIANYRAADFSIAIETADTGTLADPSISAFTDAQAEAVAVALAYSAYGFGIPLDYPSTWDGTGTACHTEPFGYPHWTNTSGKICPGEKKKAQMRELVMPRARQILADWTAPPPEELVITQDDAKLIAAEVWKMLQTTDPSGRPAPADAMLGWIRRDTALLRINLLDNSPARVEELATAVAAKVDADDITAADLARALIAELS